MCFSFSCFCWMCLNPSWKEQCRFTVFAAILEIFFFFLSRSCRSFALYAYPSLPLGANELPLCGLCLWFASKPYESRASSKLEQPPLFFVVQCITPKKLSCEPMCLPPLWFKVAPQNNVLHLNRNRACFMFVFGRVYFCFATETWYTYTHIFSMLRFKRCKFIFSILFLRGLENMGCPEVCCVMFYWKNIKKATSQDGAGEI